MCQCQIGRGKQFEIVAKTYVCKGSISAYCLSDYIEISTEIGANIQESSNKQHEFVKANIQNK